MGALLLMEEERTHISELKRKAFRGYSKATHGGGAIIDSTKGGGGTTRSTTNGGASTQTSSSGGGTSKSTNSGGGTTQTSSGGGDHHHVMFQTGGDTGASGSDVSAVGYGGATITLGPGTKRMSNISTLGASGNHSHSVSVPSHSHSFSTPNHTHSVSIPGHDHSVTIPSHTHEIELPNHVHEVKHEILELDTMPTKVEIRVDGNLVPHTATSADRLDLIPYMAKDDSGKVTRGHHELTISPNGLARIEADLILRVFIRSHMGGTY